MAALDVRELRLTAPGAPVDRRGRQRATEQVGVRMRGWAVQLGYGKWELVGCAVATAASLLLFSSDRKQDRKAQL